jgi:hypothetical protein
MLSGEAHRFETCTLVDGNNAQWIFRKRYGWLNIMGSVDRHKNRVERRKKLVACLLRSKEFEVASFEEGNLFLDKQKQLWSTNSLTRVPIPTTGVVSVKSVNYHGFLGSELILLDTNAQIWETRSYDGCNFDWKLVENLPPIRMMGASSCEMFLVTPDGQLWCYTTRSPVEGFPPIADIGQYSMRHLQTTTYFITQSGEVCKLVGLCRDSIPNEDFGQKFDIPVVTEEGQLETISYSLNTLKNLPEMVSIEVFFDAAAAIDHKGYLWAWGHRKQQAGEFVFPEEPTRIVGPKKLVRCFIGSPCILAISTKYVWALGDHRLDTDPPKDNIFTSLSYWANPNLRRYSIPFNSHWHKNYPSASSTKSAANKPVDN